MQSKVKVRLVVSVLAALMLAAFSGRAHAQTSYRFTDLGTLGGTWSQAKGVNNWGHIVGFSTLVPGENTIGVDNRAFFWANGVMTNLGSLPGGTGSEASAINNHDEVVGSCRVPGYVDHAFIWDSVNQMRDLNNLIPAGSGLVLQEATGINDLGQIAAIGTYDGVHHRAFLLTP